MVWRHVHLLLLIIICYYYFIFLCFGFVVFHFFSIDNFLIPHNQIVDSCWDDKQIFSGKSVFLSFQLLFVTGAAVPGYQGM